jgi:hypothetical protein
MRVLGVAFWLLCVAGPALAPAWAGDGFGGGWGGGFGGGHQHGAPAPLLAAGLPAFAAFGGGALTLRWARRRQGGAAKQG